MPRPAPNARWPRARSDLRQDLDEALAARIAPVVTMVEVDQGAPALRKGREVAANDPMVGLRDRCGGYFVRRLMATLGFDEQRVFNWRLEHKLIQCLVFRTFVEDGLPRTYGLRDLKRRLGTSLQSELPRIFPTGYYVKPALGDSFGGRPQWVDGLGVGGHAISILKTRLRRRHCRWRPGSIAVARSLWNEDVIVQERLAIAHEFRVHAIEREVIPDLTFGRYNRFDGAAPGRERINAFVQSLLDAAPPSLFRETLTAWDVAEAADGALRAVEINFAGFHPVHRHGFQCSAFLSSPELAPETLPRLLRFVRRRYGVEPHFDIAPETTSDMALERDLLPKIRSGLGLLDDDDDRRLNSSPTPRITRPRSPLGPLIDVVVHVQKGEEARAGLLLETFQRHAADDARLWMVAGDDVDIPDAELPAGAKRVRGLDPELVEIEFALRGQARFYLVLSPDVIFTERTNWRDLVGKGQSPVHRFLHQRIAALYAEAATTLQAPKAQWFYGLGPNAIHRGAMRALIAHLRGLARSSSQRSDDWRNWLRRQKPLPSSCLYFTYLEAKGLFSRVHYGADHGLAQGIGTTSAFAAWRPAAAPEPRGAPMLIIPRQLGLSAPEIRAKAAPLLASPDPQPSPDHVSPGETLTT